MKKFLMAAVVFAACQICASVQAADINLKSLAQHDVALSELIGDGKNTLVMVWSTDCPACEQQKPMIERFHTEFHQSKARVIGIAISTMKDLKEIHRLIETNQPSYSNFIAPAQTFLHEFRYVTGRDFKGTPTYIMFDSSGEPSAVAVGEVTRDQLIAAVTTRRYWPNTKHSWGQSKNPGAHKEAVAEKSVGANWLIFCAAKISSQVSQYHLNKPNG